MSTPKHSVSVAGIVIDDENRVLLIQRRDNGHWEPPGGVLELGETFEEGVRREVLEETGVDVRVDGLCGVYKNVARGIVALVFRCVPTGGLAGVTSESKQVRWVPLDVANGIMTPAYFVRVLDAFAEEVGVRAHDGVNLLG
jgi:8-oxo-dGTP diphosphatase